MIGQTLGHYRIEAKLGEGGMGEVYRARDTVLGREVAVKVLPADQVRADRLQRFLREAQAASQINHPNVVAIHDISESEGVHFIVMEYVAGKTLSETISPKGIGNAASGALRQSDRRVAGQGARVRRRSPRPETSQHHGHHGRNDQGARLRDRQAARTERRRR